MRNTQYNRAIHKHTMSFFIVQHLFLLSNFITWQFGKGFSSLKGDKIKFRPSILKVRSFRAFIWRYTRFLNVLDFIFIWDSQTSSKNCPVSWRLHFKQQKLWAQWCANNLVKWGGRISFYPADIIVGKCKRSYEPHLAFKALFQRMRVIPDAVVNHLLSPLFKPRSYLIWLTVEASIVVAWPFGSIEPIRTIWSDLVTRDIRVFFRYDLIINSCLGRYFASLLDLYSRDFL